MPKKDAPNYLFGTQIAFCHVYSMTYWKKKLSSLMINSRKKISKPLIKASCICLNSKNSSANSFCDDFYHTKYPTIHTFFFHKSKKIYWQYLITIWVSFIFKETFTTILVRLWKSYVNLNENLCEMFNRNNIFWRNFVLKES